MSDRVREALYVAEEFVASVQKWNGSDPEEKAEVLETIRAALSNSEQEADRG